jgi:hypothetical protein
MTFSKTLPGRSSDPYITETESVSVLVPVRLSYDGKGAAAMQADIVFTGGIVRTCLYTHLTLPTIRLV